MREAIKTVIRGTPLEELLRGVWRRMKQLRDRLGKAAPLASPDDLHRARERHTKGALKRLHTFLSAEGLLDLSPRSPPVVSVIIALFNRAELTLDCLRSLADCGAPLEIIAIDNASTDLTAKLFAQVRGVRYVRNEANLHFLKATNQGAALASGRFVLLLNNDTVVAPGAIEAAVRAIDSDPSIGAVGARLILPDGRLQEAGSFVWRDGTCQGYGRGGDPDSGEFLFPRRVDFCSGAFLLTPTAVWRELGGLDERFAPAYYEEVDYCFRLWNSGRTVVYEPRAVVHHFEFASAGLSASPQQLMLDHQKIFAERHHGVLGTRPSPGGCPEVRLRSRDAAAQKRILVCDERLPHLKTGAGYPRANRLLRTLLGFGHQVTFIPVIHVDPEETVLSIYEDIPREAEILACGYQGRSAVERLLRERPGYYTHIIISRPTTMGALRPLLDSEPDLFAGIDVVYDAEAIFALREILERENVGAPLAASDAEAKVARELTLCRGAKSVLTVSTPEAAHFKAHGYKPFVVGHAVSANVSAAAWESRCSIVFVGAIHGDGGPNFDAVVWFLDNVWSQLSRELPECRFVIAGFNRSRRLTAEPLPPRVVVTGALDDLSAVYEDARVFVAPTQASAGIPLKVVEAAGRGVPVVATELLTRQLGWAEPDELAVARSPEEFIRECVRLYTDRGAWQQQRNLALARVRAEYSEERFAEQLRAALGST